MGAVGAAGGRRAGAFGGSNSVERVAVLVAGCTVAEVNAAAGDGCGAVAGDKDADEVAGVGRGESGRTVIGRIALQAEAFNGFGKRVLLAGEAGNEATAANVAARLETSQHAEEVTPLGGVRFALEQVTEEDAVALEEHAGGGFEG